MRPLHLAILLCSSACWLTPGEVDEAKRRLQGPIPTVPTAPAPTDPPPTDTGVPLQCVEDHIDGSGLVNGTTAGAVDRFEPTCGKDSAPDRALLFTPAIDGCHRLQASGTPGMDPVIALYERCASDTSLVCNDDFTLGNSRAMLFEPLVAGESVVVVVESAADPGAWSVEAAPLADIDMGSANSTHGDTRSATGNLFDRLCVTGTDVASGAQYVRWVAPAAGTYRATLTGSGTNDGILSVHRGCSASVAELCADSVGEGVPDALDFVATSGEAVFLRVASWNGTVGAWTLGVVPL